MSYFGDRTGHCTLEGYCTKCRCRADTYKERGWHLNQHPGSMVYGEAAVKAAKWHREHGRKKCA